MKKRKQLQFKHKFNPNREYIEKATEEYLKSGGKITKIEIPRIDGIDFDFYFPKNLTNEYGF